MRSIKSANGFLLDMDGTFNRGEQLLPGALELLKHFNHLSLPFVFLTNNSSKNADEYVHKLTRLGIRKEDSRVFTSGDATIKYILNKTNYRRIYLVGTVGLEKSFTEAGLHLVKENPDAVVLGYDTSLTYAKLERLCSLLVKGYPFIATHPDINCPTETGFAPDVGAMLALIKASTGREPDLIIGKPNRIIVEMAAEVLDVDSGNLVMIGDRLYTDIALGKSAGVMTILVLTGETQLEDLKNSPFQPDFIVDNLCGILDILSA